MTQEESVEYLKGKGFHIVIWENDFVAMMDHESCPVEVYNDGRIHYLEKIRKENYMENNMIENTAENTETENNENLDLIACNDCGGKFEKTEMCKINGNYICNDCKEKNYSRCEMCGDTVHNDEMHTARNSRGDEIIICETCRYDDFFRCINCAELHPNNTAVSIDNTYDICQNCYENGDYLSCESCGAVHCADYMVWIDDNCYCESCAPNEDNENRAIHHYHHKPRLQFHRVMNEEKLYMGIELEVEGNRAKSQDLIDNYSNYESIFHCEEDSSINNGFEIVSMPCTLEYWEKEFPLKDICDFLKNNGFKSHNTTSCGLHIHVGKKRLSQSDMIKLGLFVGFNAEKLKILGRRDYNTYCKQKNIVKGKMIDASYSYSRYEAINFTNDTTIEFRFFRGTLKCETIAASIQFVHSLVKFAKSNGFPTIIKPCWDEFCTFVNNKKEYKALVEYLRSKNIMGNFCLAPNENESDC